LAVWVSRGDTLPKGLEAPHPLTGSRLRANDERFCLDPTSRVIAGPALPERPAIVPGGAQGIVSRNRRRAVLFRRSSVLADGDDRRGLAVDDGRVAAASVIGTISGHRADHFALGDLVEQLRQDRAVAIAAGGELHRPDVRSGRVHGQMHLAPLATALNAMLAGLPFVIRQWFACKPREGAIAEELDPGAVRCPAGHCAAMSREGPAGSAGLRRVDTGSGRRASSAVGTASCNPELPSPGPPSSAGWQPSLSSASAAI
jgi:hypothetical protein